MKRIGAAVLAASLSASLVLTAGPASSTPAAKVAAKNVPTPAQVVKIYPQLAGAEVGDAKGKKFSSPKADCSDGTTAAKSVFTRTMTRFDEAALSSYIAGTQVAEFKSSKAAGNAVKKFATYVKKCKSTQDAGITIKVSKLKVPRVGTQRVGFTRTVTVAGTTAYAPNAVVRKGKKVVLVSVSANTKLPAKKFTSLLKLAVKKL